MAFVHILILYFLTNRARSASHLVPNTFSPRTFGPPQLIPKKKQSRLIGPHGQIVRKTIGPQAQTVPAQLVPMDKWSSRQLVPMNNWSPKFIPVGPHATTCFLVLPSASNCFLVLCSAFQCFPVLSSAFQCFLLLQSAFKCFLSKKGFDARCSCFNFS